MILAARAIRKQYRKRKNARNSVVTAPADVAQASSATSPAEPTATNSASVDKQPITASTQQDGGENNKVNKKMVVILMIALVLPVFLETLDYTVVATATTLIASYFNHLDLQSYIGSIYLLTATVFLLPFASVADIYGRHVALQVSLGFFILGSALSTGAQNMPMMLAGRAIAGIGAAGLTAVVRIIMSDSRSLDDNNWQTTLLFLLYAIGYCIGPVIGGYLVAVNFRWIFAINLPICALSIVVAFLLLRKKVKGGEISKRHPPPPGHHETFSDKFLRIDWVGIILLVPAGILILLALGWGSSEKWNSVKVIVSFAVGGVLLILFLIWERLLERQELSNNPSNLRVLWADPVLPLIVFRSLDICIVQFASFVSGMVMLVMFYFVAIFLSLIAGYSPSKAGVQLVYFAPGVGAGSLISIQLIKRTRQPRYSIVLGSLILPIALGLTSWAANENKQSQLNGFLILAGAGVGLSMGALAIQARFKQPADRVAVVSSLTLCFRSLGGTVGVAQCATVLNAKVRSGLTHAIASGAISSSDLSSLTGTSIASIQTLNSLPPEAEQIVKNAFGNGLRWAFISLIPWAGVSFFLTLLLQRIPDGDEIRQETEVAEEKAQALQVHTPSGSEEAGRHYHV